MSSLAGGTLAGLIVWIPMGPAVANLGGEGHLIRLVVTALAAVLGLLAGSAVSRRARRSREHLGLFAGLTGGVAGALVGAAAGFLVVVSYVITYGHLPADLGEVGLAVLAVISLTSLAMFLGGISGGVLGALLGGALKLTIRSR